MKFLPYDRFEIETAMTPETIVEILKPKVDPEKLFRFSREHAPFQGTISQEGFNISRIIHYRNSFLPIISGKFLPKASGTKVIIKMYLHPLITLFMCVWFGGIGLACFVIADSVLNGKKPISFAMLIPFGMLIFGWAIVSFGFWFEVKKQKPMITEMFNNMNISS